MRFSTFLLSALVTCSAACTRHSETREKAQEPPTSFELRQPVSTRAGADHSVYAWSPPEKLPVGPGMSPSAIAAAVIASAPISGSLGLRPGVDFVRCDVTPLERPERGVRCTQLLRWKDRDVPVLDGYVLVDVVGNELASVSTSIVRDVTLPADPPRPPAKPPPNAEKADCGSDPEVVIWTGRSEAPLRRGRLACRATGLCKAKLIVDAVDGTVLSKNGGCIGIVPTVLP